MYIWCLSYVFYLFSQSNTEITPHPQGQWAGGTHPTGMHPCYSYNGCCHRSFGWSAQRALFEWPKKNTEEDRGLTSNHLFDQYSRSTAWRWKKGQGSVWGAGADVIQISSRLHIDCFVPSGQYLNDSWSSRMRFYEPSQMESVWKHFRCYPDVIQIGL